MVDLTSLNHDALEALAARGAQGFGVHLAMGLTNQLMAGVAPEKIVVTHRMETSRDRIRIITDISGGPREAR